MKLSKKILLSLAILISCIFTFTVTFAATNNTNTNNMGSDFVNGVRGVVGGAENAIEDVGTGVMNGVRDMTGTENNTNDTTSNNGSGTTDTTNTMNNASTTNTAGTDNGTTIDNGMSTRTAGTDNTGYTATRTAATNDGTFMGMNSTAWIWLIMGIVAVAIITLVWSYGSERDTTRNYHND